MFNIPLSEAIKKSLKPALWGNAQKQVFKDVRMGKSSVFMTNNKELVMVAKLEGREFVVVALTGKNLLANRQEIIDFALSKGAITVRFHTKNPKHLDKGLTGIRAILSEIRPSFFGGPEYVYRVGIA
jgi:hypothetical protein